MLPRPLFQQQQQNENAPTMPKTIMRSESDINKLRLKQARFEKPVRLAAIKDDSTSILNEALVFILAFLIELGQKVQLMAHKFPELSYTKQKVLSIFLVAQTVRCFDLNRLKDLLHKRCKVQQTRSEAEL